MKPYLSIIVASRNDNHGGDMTRRMRLFVTGLIEQCNRFNLSAELIIVDWNPPLENLLLWEVLPKPSIGDKLSLRYIIVPPSINACYLHSKTIPLFQMIAKNVGIRRAKGEFVLCTNVDLLFSDKLMAELAAKNLEAGKFYRANRCDVPKSIPENKSVKEQLKWCKENILLRQGVNSKFRNLPEISHERTAQYPLLFKLLNFFAGQVRPKLDPEGFTMTKIDTMACGDFTLMSKNDWLNIQGYLEMDLYSIHIDSMALHAAVALGMQQVVYPIEACTYHIYHEEGWASMNPLKALHFLERRPGMDWHVMYDSGKYIIRNKTNHQFNPPEWGFANHYFEEKAFNA